jgi:hypothetical protein
MRRLYAKFRISPAFLLVLLAFIVASIAAHHLWDYDSDWTVTNLVLSFEASLSVCIFMQDSAQFEHYVRGQQGMHADNLRRIESVILASQDQALMTMKMMERLWEDRPNTSTKDAGLTNRAVDPQSPST